MTIAAALRWATRELGASAAATVDARLLLQHVLQQPRPYLVAHGDEELTPAQQASFEGLVARAAQREPVPYLIGSAPFYGLDFAVSPAVLIPRPETELLVEAALQWAASRSGLRVVDVGTGSGCIAVTLAKHLPGARIVATDVSAPALALAQENAARHGVAGQIAFVQGSLLEPLSDRPDLVVANLPYIGDDEWTELEGGVKWYEPAVALRGGPTGLELVGLLLQQARPRLQVGGALFLEIGWRQGATARFLAQERFPQAQIELLRDYSGHERVLAIKS
ncbi:MAG: peptide chain release factor N(5)-glutamine methyltransferase [Anaerolineae bacterium]|nr:peptide chain release factor N(5)-glutamine methyltransferase [Anaerolineae bacterium]